jgi:hypothetical protein
MATCQSRSTIRSTVGSPTCCQTYTSAYRRPLFVAETGIEGDLRASWLRIIGHEVVRARKVGIPVDGICLYPIVDYPGWNDDRHCHTGLFGYPDGQGVRPLCQALAEELECSKSRIGAS